MNKSFKETEKWLKRVLKNRVKVEQKTIIAYLMLGIVGLTFSTKTMAVTAVTTNGTAVTSNGQPVYVETGDTTKKNVEIGSGAEALEGGPGSTAIGYNAKSNIGRASTAIGSEANAVGRFSGALGYKATSYGADSFAIGTEAVTGISEEEQRTKYGKTEKFEDNYGAQSLAIGSKAKAIANNSVATGFQASAMSNESVAIGSNAFARTRDKGNKVTAIGAGAIVDGGTLDSSGTTAIGGNALAGLLYRDAAGNAQNTANYDHVEYRTDTGGITENNIFTLAGITKGSTQRVNDATAIGYDSRAIGDQSIAIGPQTVAGHASVAIGGNDRGGVSATANTNYEKIVGNVLAQNSFKSYNYTAADGTKKQAYAFIEIENGVKVTKYYDTADVDPNTLTLTNKNAQPIDATVVDTSKNVAEVYPTTRAQDGSVAIGQKAYSDTSLGTAIGLSAAVNKNSELGTAIGAGAKVGDGVTPTQGGVAIAAGSFAKGNHTTAVGTGSKALAVEATAVGYKAQATGVNSLAVGSDARATAGNALAYGYQAYATQSDAVAIGTRSNALAANAIAFGTDTNVTGQRSVALGSDIKTLSTTGSVVLGDASTEVLTNTDGTLKSGASHGVTTVKDVKITTNKGTEITFSGFAGQPKDVGKYVSIGAVGAERQLKNVAAGAIAKNSTDAINGSQLYAVAAELGNQVVETGSIYFHTNDGTGTQDSGDSVTNKGKITDKAGATGNYSVTAGLEANASGNNSVAIGYKSKSIGGVATDTGTGGVAIGGNATSYTGGVAIGPNAKILGQSSFGSAGAIAIGKNANVDVSDGTATASIAIGNNAYAQGSKNGETTAYNGDKIPTGVSISIGDYAYSALGSTALGASATAKGSNATAVGRNTNAEGHFSTAISVNAKATADSAVAVGRESQATAVNALAFGAKTQANGNYSVAIGGEAKASSTEEAAVAIGYFAGATGKSSVALGRQASATAVQAAALGPYSKAQAKNSIASGVLATTTGESSIAFGTKANVSGTSSIAIGTGNIVSGNYSGVFGDPSIVAGAGSYTFGNDNAVGSTSTNVSVLGNNNQIGATATYDTNGKLQTASGLTDTAAVENSKAIGNNNYINTSDTYILGSGVGIKDDGTVIGTVENSVYLGNDSTIAKGNGIGTKNIDTEGLEETTTTAGDTGTVDKAIVNEITYGGFAGAKADGAVTVGSAGLERRIMNVAAGEISSTSTDAINGSQLYYVAKQAATPFTITANTNQDTDAKNLDKQYVAKDGKQVQLGNTFSIEGAKDSKSLSRSEDTAVDSPYSAKNIQTIVDDKGVQIQFAEKPEFDEIKVKNGDTDTNPVTITSGTGTTGGTISNLEIKLSDNTKDGTKPADLTTTNAATLGDVLNAGWNLQGNGTAVDFVKPYDTVNFVNGTGTTVEVTTDDNLTSTIKINTVMQYTDADGNPVVKGEDGKYYPVDPTTGKADTTKPEVTNVQISTVNPDGTSTTPTKVGNVESSLNTLTKDIDTDGNKTDGTPKAETKLVNLTESTVNPNAVATVGDLQNMGWIVKAQSNEYADVVKNANEVEFRGVGLNVSGETEAATGKRVITIKAESDILSELESELIKNGDPNATGEATLSGKIALKADNSASGYATAGNVKDMINYAGWQLHENGERKELINAGDQVNFVNGTGTIVSVTSISDSNDNNKTIGSNVTFNVDKGTITTETKDGNPTGKVVGASDTTPNKVATVENVVNAINNSGFTLKTSATTDGTKVSGTDEIINPGDTVEMVAGKNLTVKQEADGKITYATKDDVEFNTVKIGDETDGKSPVELKTEKATPATNNPDGKAPTTALNITSTDGNPTQITGVGSVLDTTTVATNPNGTAAEDKLVNLGTKDKPLPDSTLNSAATVRDLANMGWVVKASGDGYTDTVKNANVVDFVGENGITVTGKTKDDGTREIKVSLEKGEVVKSNEFTITDKDGTNPVKAIKIGDNYYNKADIDPTTGKPKDGTNSINVDNKVVENKGTGFVTGNTVADAIQKSGFTVGKNTDTTGVVFDNKDEKVNPDDNLRYADGKGTVVNLGTVKAIDENGTISTTTTVKVDVDTAKLETNTDGTVKTPVTAEKAKELADAITKAEEALKADPTNSDLQKALAAAEKAANDAGLNKIATAQDVANAINNSGWTATSGVEGTGEFASGNKTTSELINPGETVTLKAGDNLKIKQAGNNFTYSLNSNLKGLESIEVTDGTNTTTIKPGVIEGLTTTLEDNTTSGTKPANITTTNAATLGDVLNAGWNLQENGQAKDFVKPYDTVNFVDGKGTVANVTTDGNVSNITFNIDTAKLENNADGTVKDILSAADAKKLTDAVTDAKDNLKAAEKELANATTAAEKAEAAQKVAQAATKLSTAEKAANDAGLNKIATAQDVANAINNSGWNATSGTGVNGGEVTGTTKELVNPGETVTFDAGKNMKLVQEGNKFTYATKDDVEFTTVTTKDAAGNTTVINGGGVTITPEGVDSEKNPEKVVSITNKGVSAGGNKITNVAPGTEPNDAVNVSQLKGVEQNINNRMGDLDSKVNRGLAGAAALSGIEFMDIGINQATIAAAVGGYKGTHAVAVGMEAAPTENTRVNAKISLTPGSRVDSLYSVGAAYRFNWK